MDQPRVEFEEEGHIYRVNGRRVLSVTQCLALVDDRYRIDPYYLQRGRYVHKACELYDNDDLDEDTVDPEIRPYLEAYRKFRIETGFHQSEVECLLYHPQYSYAGKIDRIGILNTFPVLIDLKSGVKARVDELQLAAYWALCNSNSIPIKKVFDLYLKDNGTYSLVEIPNPKLLFPTFLAVLRAAIWKEGL